MAKPASASYNQTDDDPVVEVTWNDAGKFCEWLSKKEGKPCELPTEAEWEYACRAGTTTAFSFGDDPKALGDYAWYANNSGNHTHPVGVKAPNPWGLYDMHGDVWQWCADNYDKDYYAKSPIKDPKDTNSGQSRVLRGGSWAANRGLPLGGSRRRRSRLPRRQRRLPGRVARSRQDSVTIYLFYIFNFLKSSRGARGGEIRYINDL